MLTSVAVLVMNNVSPFELGTVCEVFGIDRGPEYPRYDFALCSADGGPVMTKSGFTITPHADLTPIATADLVVVPAHPLGTPAPAQVLDVLRDAAARGAYLLSVCSGAFLFGEAGLLDGRRCTTHWMYAAELARRFPLAQVHPNALYVEDGKLLTSAGTAAGIDLCLHLVRMVHGSQVATKLARRMVVPPHRDGGQAQYVEVPLPKVPDSPTLEPLLTWLITNLDKPVDIDAMARRAHMAPRTFARRFRAETGTTPHDWLTAQRILLARRLLEETELGVDAVALRSGFGDASMLRHHFSRRVGATPHAYRSVFRDRAAAPASA
jgi:AraC family transcriptional regulator, transcriptional activator FtrA